ncbi:hypothetical protein [Hymenobacter fodinae]|uniref:Uncharacterized protein n=1 Tax=Hymenobacter fodinae TaxID=2510796 RepID=A0A4Z0P1F2_9BACT|nr:hypothetical protein [Hymenobacter fodinae]TGE04612.1 hypothetical protein EU556_20725 [Hymenobacter fodinae]
MQEHTALSHIRSLKPKITDRALLAEIGRRGLTRAGCEAWLLQAAINKVNAFAFANDKGGHWCYYRNAEKYQEHEKTIGPTGIRTIPASPKAERITALIFVSPFDYLTYRHLRVKPEPEQMHIVTLGQTEEAAAVTIADPRIEKVIFFGNGDGSEHAFLAQMDQQAFPVLVHEYEGLSDAFMTSPSSVAKSFAPAGPQADQTQAASFTLRAAYRLAP